LGFLIALKPSTLPLPLAQPNNPHYQTIKTLIDKTISLAALVLLSPLFVLVALLIKATSPGPIFFVQTREGLHGNPFRMIKFRTMHIGSENQQASLLPFNELSGPAFKIKNDPRTTRIGSLLRQTSIDELPQFWNILQGQMTLVGPRPLPPRELSQIEPQTRMLRNSVKPGLTCLWQIRGRNKISSFADWMKLDLEYITNQSLILDLKILFKTIPIVLSAHGAH
jgi:lipopolysaccharide/colanic/teichoic acid biosynthesis glycosyltransferase